MNRRRLKLTYSNVMATIAVFIALGGVSYAASSLSKNSVGTPQLRSGAVTGAKIKNGAVTTAKLANGAVTGPKLDLSSLGTVPSAAHATSADSAVSAATAGTATRATQAEFATHATQADSATNADSATRADSAADADALGGSPPSTYLTRGYGSATHPVFSLGSFSEVTSIEVPVGSEPHHVLIVSSAQVRSNAEEECLGYIALEWDGTEQPTTYALGTTPSIEFQNGWESLATSAMPMLPAGTQKITLLGGAGGNCHVEDGRLDAVVLGN
jgi:hypothetical protein